MAVYQGFVGGSVPSRSKTVNCERTVNLYPEHSVGTPKRDPSLMIRPAVVPWTFANGGSVASPIRAMFHQDGRFNVVSGGFYYDIARSRNVTQIGQVQQDSKPAFIATNGTGGFQNLIVSGGQGYIHNFQTGVFQQISDPNFPTPVSFVVYIDGYFIVKQKGTTLFAASNLMDGLVWNGLEQAQSMLSSDIKEAMVASHRELWFLGSRYTEVWGPDASASPPFSPLSGVFVEHGIAAPYSVVRLDNTIYWIGLDEAGTAVVWRANGYTPERISDHAIEYVLKQEPHLENAVGFAFQVSGHAWYALYIPDAETTWLFDVGANVWTEWGIWDDVALRFRPFIGWQQCSGWGENFIGARNNGTIYRISLDDYADSIVTVGGV